MMPEPLPSLQVTTPETGAGAGALDTVAKFATIQNALNQNRLFQQTFAARQKAGQIIAGAPDLETGIKNMFADPDVAAFAGPIANDIRQQMDTQANVATKRQTLAQNAIDFAIRKTASALYDPALFATNLKSGLAAADPMTAPHMQPFVDSFVRSVGYGLPADPTTWTPQQKSKYQANLSGALLSAGFTDSSLKLIQGNVTTVPGMTASGIRGTQGVVQAPAFAGGGLTPTGQVIPEGMPASEASSTEPGPLSSTLQPQVVTRGDVFRGAVPSLGGSMQGGNLLVPGASATNPLATVPALASAGAATAPAPGQAKAIEGAAQNYTEEGRKTYDAAVTGLGSVQYMDRAFDELSKNGGWEVPGTAVNARLGIAKGINTLAQVMGVAPADLPFDTSKVATWEDSNKETQRATLQLVNQMFGAQRESQLVVQGASKAIPGAENTPLGGKLVLKSLEQTMLREIDRRNFETNWFNAHSGNLIGANEAFNTQYKPQLYSQRAISTVQPYEVSSPSEASAYLPGTLVKRKSDGAVFSVTPTVSKYAPVVLQQSGQ